MSVTGCSGRSSPISRPNWWWAVPRAGTAGRGDIVEAGRRDSRRRRWYWRCPGDDNPDGPGGIEPRYIEPATSSRSTFYRWHRAQSSSGALPRDRRCPGRRRPRHPGASVAAGAGDHRLPRRCTALDGVATARVLGRQLPQLSPRHLDSVGGLVVLRRQSGRPIALRISAARWYDRVPHCPPVLGSQAEEVDPVITRCQNRRWAASSLVALLRPSAVPMVSGSTAPPRLRGVLGTGQDGVLNSSARRLLSAGTLGSPVAMVAGAIVAKASGGPRVENL